MTWLLLVTHLVAFLLGIRWATPRPAQQPVRTSAPRYVDADPRTCSHPNMWLRGGGRNIGYDCWGYCPDCRTNDIGLR